MTRTFPALLGCLAVLAVAHAQTSDGPSFSCTHATGPVNQLICSSSRLSALDRELARVYKDVRSQAPTDQMKLRSDERAWLASLQRDCADEACIQRKYEARLSELRQASPSAARGLVGKRCTFQLDTRGPVIPGYMTAPRFQPINLPGGVTVVREKDGVRYAFLALVEEGSCEVRDVVTLPSTAADDLFLQCLGFDPPFTGFGIRNLKTHGLDALWSFDTDRHALKRVPTNLPGVRCQQPEAPE